MKTLLLFFLFAGLFEFRFARNRLQSFEYRNGDFSPNDALNICTSNNESLITLFDREHVDVVSNYLKACNTCYTGFWVGLKEKPENRGTWSDGTEVTFNRLSVTEDKYQQTCAALTCTMDDVQWTGHNCSERMFFMCNTEKGYEVIKSQKDWCQALQYCKKHYKGLATINSTEENEQAYNTSHGLTVWIGLMNDQWEWPNQECSLFREWCAMRIKDSDSDSDSKSSQDGSCAFLLDSFLKTEDCSNNKNVLCSKGKVRIKVIQDNLSWDEALTYCETMHSRLLWIENDGDQEAVSSWLNHYTFDANTPRSLWIGLRQSALFGFWIWSDRMVNWSNWKDGNIPEKSQFHHCGVIDRKDFTWRNEDCDRKLPFLCEEDVVDFKN